MKIKRLNGTNVQINDEASLVNNGFNFFRNAEYVIIGNCIE